MASLRKWIFLALIARVALADEVLPSVPREKMSEYKNAFATAISESKGTPPPGGGPGNDKHPGKHPPPKGADAKPAPDKFGGPGGDGPSKGGPRGGGHHGPGNAFPDGFNGPRRPPGPRPGGEMKAPPPR